MPRTLKQCSVTNRGWTKTAEIELEALSNSETNTQTLQLSSDGKFYLEELLTVQEKYDGGSSLSTGLKYLDYINVSQSFNASIYILENLSQQFTKLT